MNISTRLTHGIIDCSRRSKTGLVVTLSLPANNPRPYEVCDIDIAVSALDSRSTICEAGGLDRSVVLKRKIERLQGGQSIDLGWWVHLEPSTPTDGPVNSVKVDASFDAISITGSRTRHTASIRVRLSLNAPSNVKPTSDLMAVRAMRRILQAIKDSRPWQAGYQAVGRDRSGRFARKKTNARRALTRRR